MNSDPATARNDSVSPVRVLIAEDEAHLGTILQQYLSARGFDVTVARNGRVALDLLRTQAFDVALLDVVMPEVDGLEVLRLIREEPFRETLPPEIIVITGNGTVETAMAALKLGAYDVLSKPYRMAEIDALVRRAFEKRMLIHNNRALHRQLRRVQPSPVFVTQFAPLMAVLSLIGRVASSASPVLVQGEAGTGKRLLARVVHDQSGRAAGPFVEADCRAFATPDQATTEMFGSDDHTSQTQPGLLELAAGGTLYLNNVHALPDAVQQALVRVFDPGAPAHNGGPSSMAARARLVVSTERDLSRMVAAGEFREDLLHVISAIRVFVPPLRDRVTDVTLLAHHFVHRFAPDRPIVLTSDALAALEHYRWPGNVSELRNVIERAVLLAVNGTISAQDFPFAGAVLHASRQESTAPMTLEALERRHVAEVLEQTQWHQGRAAELLGISPKTLYRKIREFGFKRPTGRN